MTSWLRLVSLVRFRPRVPFPEPELAVMVQVLPAPALTSVMAGEPRRPEFTKVQLLAVRLLTGAEKLICQDVLEVLVGLEPRRPSVTTVASGRSTGVTVGLAEPATDGSSVSTFAKFPPLVVPWLVMAWVFAGSLILTV